MVIPLSRHIYTNATIIRFRKSPIQNTKCNKLLCPSSFPIIFSRQFVTVMHLRHSSNAELISRDKVASTSCSASSMSSSVTYATLLSLLWHPYTKKSLGRNVLVQGYIYQHGFDFLLVEKASL
ncbi:hypothetical protein CY34DRAFT_391119 [Suillus luteus UH-Slu-Lm8-n1]|uniref:Uncharacterized protein n=1 Tax=Suillus luteus UH-Slu-Lm8-n1 TaxID=930992 RepID=A0A0D0BU54_9AGAM|nr:hypothetical protein CY34DRAFT_391119 [Suillus luteus UH-Slu-Lm8-n1]